MKHTTIVNIWFPITNNKPTYFQPLIAVVLFNVVVFAKQLQEMIELLGKGKRFESFVYIMVISAP